MQKTLEKNHTIPRHLLIGTQQAHASCIADESGSIIDFELLHNLGAIRVVGFDAKLEFFGTLVERVASRQQA